MIVLFRPDKNEGRIDVFYVQPEYKESVMSAMKDLMYIPFEFENGGTRVIHYSPETYIPR